jgi:uncharacterized membrane protein YeaQ/YmgE (transglycosylase-associated protein family)
VATIGLVLFLVALGVGLSLFGASISLLYYMVSGLIVGALGRLVLPGREKIGLLGTSLIGIAGSTIGGYVGRALHVGSFAELALSVASAAVLLSVLGFRARG